MARTCRRSSSPPPTGSPTISSIPETRRSGRSTCTRSSRASSKAPDHLVLELAGTHLLRGARALEAVARVEALGGGVHGRHPQEQLLATLAADPLDDMLDQGVADARAPEARIDPHRDQSGRARGVAVGCCRRPGDDAVDLCEERRPRREPPAPGCLVEADLAGVGRAEGVRRLLQRVEADAAVELPVVRTEAPDASCRGRTPSAPSSRSPRSPRRSRPTATASGSAEK